MLFLFYPPPIPILPELLLLNTEFNKLMSEWDILWCYDTSLYVPPLEFVIAVAYWFFVLPIKTLHGLISPW